MRESLAAGVPLSEIEPWAGFVPLGIYVALRSMLWPLLRRCAIWLAQHVTIVVSRSSGSRITFMWGGRDPELDSDLTPPLLGG